MEISKKVILIYVAITEAILICAHLVIYEAFLFFFPELRAVQGLLLGILLFLAVSFNLSWYFDFKSGNKFSRWFYIISACWMPMWTYILFALALTSIIYLTLPLLPISPVALGLILLAILINIYGIINARIIRVKKIKIKLENLPEFWKNKTAIMLSDTHLGHVLRAPTAKKIVTKINSLKPEIVFISGDLFDGPALDFNSLASPFNKIDVTFGTYFCTGNHELYAGLQNCLPAINAAGIKILENEKVEIEGLQIAGLTYTEDKNINNIQQILSEMNINKQKPSILLKHVPSQIPLSEQAGFSLQLSGHTHKVQVWPLSLIAKKIFKGFDYGLKKLGRLQVYTSSGVGTWGPPVRIFTPSEIVQITFV